MSCNVHERSSSNNIVKQYHRYLIFSMHTFLLLSNQVKYCVSYMEIFDTNGLEYQNLTFLKLKPY